MDSRPLDHITVLDLTRNIAGSLCTKLLADFGADVIKVESPGEIQGIRDQAPFVHDERGPELSLWSLYLNGNKKCVTLNLETDVGVSIFKRLAMKANLVLEDFAPGTMERLGLDHQALIKLKRNLSMVSVSNFGQTGPYKDYSAVEITFEALCGVMYGLGPYDEPPVKNGGSVFQCMAGLAAAGAVLTALYDRNQEDAGTYIDFSIAEAILHSVCVPFVRYTYTGQVQRREMKYSGDGHAAIPTTDGFITPFIFGYVDMELLSHLVEEPELAEPKFSSYHSRIMNLREFDSVLKRAFASHSKGFFHTAQEYGFGFAAIENIAEVVKSPQLAAREFFTPIEHPVVGEVGIPWPPFKTSEELVQSTPTHIVGEDNRKIYTELLGISENDLTRLKAEGVI